MMKNITAVAIILAIALLLPVPIRTEAAGSITAGERAVIVTGIVLVAPFVAGYYVIKYVTWPIWYPISSMIKYYEQNICSCCEKRSPWIIDKDDRCPDCRQKKLCQPDNSTKGVPTHV